MKPLAFAAFFVVIAALGCKGSEEASSTGTPSTPPATTGTPAATFASAKDVLATNCLGCHSGAGAKEGIDYSSYETIMKGGEGGPVVVAGDPAGSMVIKAMRGNGAKQMPPGKTVPEDQIKIVEAWIQAGAKNE